MNLSLLVSISDWNGQMAIGVHKSRTFIHISISFAYPLGYSKGLIR